MKEPKNVGDMSRRQINAYCRAHDESHLWPICGRFNATERAIRRTRRKGFGVHGGLEYYLAIELELSLIRKRQTVSISGSIARPHNQKQNQHEQFYH